MSDVEVMKHLYSNYAGKGALFTLHTCISTMPRIIPGKTMEEAQVQNSAHPVTHFVSRATNGVERFLEHKKLSEFCFSCFLKCSVVAVVSNILFFWDSIKTVKYIYLSYPDAGSPVKHINPSKLFCS